MMKHLPCLTLALLLAACTDSGAAPPDSAQKDIGTDVALPDGSAPIPDADGDAGVDGPAPDTTSCAPAPPVANAQLFTQLQADLAALSDAAQRQARVDKFMADVAASGGFPVRDGTQVVFLYQGSAAGPLSVAGTFNNWKPGVDQLQSISGTDLRYLVRQVGPARQEYKLVDASGSWFRDPKNPHVVWDGIPNAGLGAFNSVLPPWGAPDPNGRIELLQVTSPQLNNTREVYVYLPAAYDKESCARYPVLLVNDGNESITRSHFDQVAATTFAAGQAAPAILVFVGLASQADRMSEYSCDTADHGDEYADFLCDTLLPRVDQRYRTEGTPASRGIIGASLGGLIAYAALWWRNDCLRRAGAQSGSFWYKNDMMIQRVQSSSSGIQLSHAYLDNGSDNRDSTLAMRDALKAAGFSVYHWEKTSQDHTWDAWQDRFDEALTQLLPAP